MSKELPIDQDFCTYEELKSFTNNFTELSIIKISEFIETKTDRKYSVIERKMLCDLNKQLFDNNMATFTIAKFLNELWDINKDKKDGQTVNLIKAVAKFLNETWSNVIEKNHLIIHKWKKQLKEFE